MTAAKLHPTTLVALRWLRANDPKPLLQKGGRWYPAGDWRPGTRVDWICRTSHAKDLLELGFAVSVRGKRLLLTELGRTAEVR